MKYLTKKYILYLVFTGFAAVIAVRAGYRLLKEDGESVRTPLPYHLEKMRIRELTEGVDPLVGGKVSTFDFGELIRLIDHCLAVKRDFVARFDYMSPKKLDVEYVSGLLQSLLFERVKLRDYIWEVKGGSRSAMPVKKYRALMYYMEVLDYNIADMKELLRGHRLSGEK
ncbi:hypothetical protein K2X40_03375 [Candidatus Babeliales bacterium]|nr:hypothetical protein [Candidatus Babeliales bacterium]